MAVREYGDGLLCAKAEGLGRDEVETRKQTGRDHVRARRLDLMRKSQERRAKALKTGVEGDGRTRSSSQIWAPFLDAMRNGTKRCSAGRTDVLLRERERSWGQRVGRKPKTICIIFRYTIKQGGAQGPQTHWAPRTWHALGLSFPPPSLWRESFATGRHFQVFSAYEIYFCCRRAAAILSSHVTLEPARRRTRTDTKERIIWKKFCNFVSFFFFNGKGEVFLYFGRFDKHFKHVLKL